ncbi:MAG: TetR/AcrR family transcriptional regulator [Bacteroidetes bacterium]|nr:TetR/AcrR family transcriptional regulator [Bacteroidota bacterium]
MGISERKEREKIEMKSLILKAAQRQFLELGYDKTSIRSIAKEIEFSPATLYLYYKDKNELLYDLHTEGFKLLFARMVPLANIKDPMQRIYKTGLAYLNFAFENPEYYELMFMMTAPMECMTDKDWKEGDQAFGFLVSSIEECKQKGHFKKHESGSLAYLLWSNVHGLASLKIKDRMRVCDETGNKADVYTAYEYFFNMIKKN